MEEGWALTLALHPSPPPPQSTPRLASAVQLEAERVEANIPLWRPSHRWNEAGSVRTEGSASQPQDPPPGWLRLPTTGCSVKLPMKKEEQTRRKISNAAAIIYSCGGAVTANQGCKVLRSAK